MKAFLPIRKWKKNDMSSHEKRLMLPLQFSKHKAQLLVLKCCGN